MTEKILLGDFIYQRRRALGMTQIELAEKLGLTNKAVSKWETFEANPELSIITKLAAALNVTADELLNCKLNDEVEEEVVQEKPKADDEWEETSLFGVIKGKVRRTSSQYEFVSNKKTAINKTPFLHINVGQDKYGAAKAHGIVAIGNRAKGIISLGLIAYGIVSIGLISAGLLSVGLLTFGLFVAVGLLANGIGVSVGLVAVGALSVGFVSVGVMSVGWVSIGVYAHTGANGIAIGIHKYFHPLVSSDYWRMLKMFKRY